MNSEPDSRCSRWGDTCEGQWKGFTVCIASLFMTTFVSRVSMSPLSSRNGFPTPSNVANRLSYSLFEPILYFLRQYILNYASLVTFTVAFFLKFKMVARYHVGSNWY